MSKSDQRYVHADPADDRTHPRAADVDTPVDKVVFVTAMAITIGFVLWGVFSPTSLADTASAVLGKIIDSTGWIYVLATAGFVVLMLLLALSRYGRIRLGRDDERPEFSTMSWISMMFATGMGIGLIFWGVAEPLSHLLTPPMDMAEAESPEAAALGMQYTLFHWGSAPLGSLRCRRVGPRLRNLPQGAAEPAQLDRLPQEEPASTSPARSRHLRALHHDLRCGNLARTGRDPDQQRPHAGL